MSLEVESPQRYRFFRRGFRGLLNRRDRTGSVRELVSVPLSVAPPAHAMFQEARNTNIRNATFNIYGTVPGVAAPSQVERSDTQVSSHTHPSSAEDNAPHTPSPLNSMSSSVASDAFPVPQSSPEIYVRSLIGRNRGYPLWIPSPNMLLPVCYRASGVRIGDVGIITPEGGFSFFFNVCHEISHPINASRRLPAGFVPFATSLADCDIEEFKEYSSGNYLSDDSVHRMDTGNEMFKTVLQTSAMHAAVLMMPEPIYISKLQTLGLFRKYVHDNLRSWYSFIKVVLGRDADNGELRVVYGCRKSTAFGIATVNKGTTNAATELTFSVDDIWAAATGCKYRWHHRGSAETKAGPSVDEKRDVIAFNENTCDPVNQCLFMSTIDIRLSEDEWQQIELGGAVSVPNQNPDIQATSFSHAVFSPPEGGHRLAGVSSTNLDYGDRTRSVSLLAETSSTEDVDEEAYQPTFSPEKRLFHPSDILSDYLLWAAPDATSVVVCTDDWVPCMDDSITSVSMFISVVLSNNEVCEDNGTIFLTRKIDSSLSISSETEFSTQRVQPDQEHAQSTIRNDPIPPLMQSDTGHARQIQTLSLVTEVDFPPLVPSAPSASAATAGWGASPRFKTTIHKAPTTVPKAPAVVHKTPVFSDSFTVGVIELANQGTRGKPATLSQVVKEVMAKYHVKIEASTSQRGLQTTFHIKAESQKHLNEAKRYLSALISPIVTLVIDVPASTIGSIIGPKGATLKQIRDQTGVRIDIPKREGLSGPGVGKSDNTHDDDGEAMIPVSLIGPTNLAYEAQELVKQIVSSKTSKATKRIRDIPDHILPFVLMRRARFLSAAPEGTVNLSLNAPREITANGDREAVDSVIGLIKQTMEQLASSLTSVKIALPQRQHRLLTGSNADTVLAKSRCVVVAGKAEEEGDEVTIWGQPADLPKGLSAVMVLADLQYNHEYLLPGPASLSKQLAAYLSHVNYANVLQTAHPTVDVHLPAPEATTYSIDLLGVKADVDVVVNQISELLGRLIGSTRDITIDWHLHGVISDKNAQRLKQLHEAHNVNIYFPLESAKSSSVLLVYDPWTPNASVVPDEKKKHLDEAESALLKWISEAADVKTEKISVEKRWHDTVVGNLFSMVGEDKALSIKVGADASDATTEDIIFVRGVSEAVDKAVKHILRIVEEAKEDEIVNSYSTEFDIDKEYVGQIVGSQGASVKKLREQLDVKVDVLDDVHEEGFQESSGGKKKRVATHVKSTVKITGRKENVEEAKRRILAHIQRLADETQEILKIPAQYHSSLIGEKGKYAIRLEERYGVKITFPRQSAGAAGGSHERLKPDEVLVKGNREGVFEAKSELLEAAEFEKDNNNILKFNVPTRSVARILGRGGASINEIQDATDAQIDVDKGAGETTAITLRGTKKAIAAAKAAILAISEQVTEEATATLIIENKFHRTIIGAGGQGLKDLISRCGGPPDPKLQAGLIRFPRQGDSSEEVRIRGEPKLVQRIKAELESTLATLRDRVVLGVELPSNRHGVLIGRDGSNLRDLQNKFNVQIQFPRSRSYGQLGELDNSAELGKVNATDLVKVSGRLAACEQAIAELRSHVNSTDYRSEELGLLGFRVGNETKHETKHSSFKHPPSEVRGHASSTPRGSFTRR